MEWGAPAYLWLFLAAVPLLLLCAAGGKRRRRLREALAGPGDRPPGSKLGKGITLARWGFRSAAGLLLVVTLGSPQWGSDTEERPNRGGDLLVVLDTSKSMLAADLGKSRLAAAKEAVALLSRELDGDRIGLVAFAGSAFLVCPLTTDYALFNGVLAAAGTDTIPLGGSSLAAALKEAGRAFGGGAGGGKVLILISDGEDHGGDYAAAASQLQDAGVKLYAVAAGTAAGGLIPLPGGEFLQDRGGSAVLSRLRPEPLREVVRAAGGTMVGLSALPALLSGLSDREAGACGPKRGEGSRQRPGERFQLPLALALALLAVEPLLGVRGRR